jgi:phosphonate transport system substrate-binding protein
MIGYVLLVDDPTAQAAIEALAQELTNKTGLTFGAVIYPSHQQLLDAMKMGGIQAAWLQPITYLYASARGFAEASLLTNHFGTYYYGTQILANIENGFTSYFDTATSTSQADAETALSQLAGLRPCWAEEGSLSGHIYPLGLFNQLSIEILPGAVVQSHTAVVRSLYIKGICDFGASFSYTGDPRTASAVITDLPDVEQKVVILWQSPADIPNLNFSIIPGLDASIRTRLTTSLVDLVKTDTGRQMLTDAAGGYDIQDLRVIDNSVYDPLRETVRRSAVDLTELLGR